MLWRFLGNIEKCINFTGMFFKMFNSFKSAYGKIVPASRITNYLLIAFCIDTVATCGFIPVICLFYLKY